MLSLAENRFLTQTSLGSPMGQYFRQFMQPIALSRELPQPDCPPIRLKILGESLLAFRDSMGRVGLVEPTCPHRGADLFYGRNEQCGLRCVYHGWKFDIHGKAVDLPNVPPGSAYHDTMRIRAYPTVEFGEVVWAYLGPQLQAEGHMPTVPQLEFGLVPQNHRYVTKRLQQCNWAQSIEGALDTAHFSFLHMPAPSVANNENPDAPADERRLRWIREDPMPRFSIVEHDVGFVIGAARRADENDLYWRITQFMLPAHSSTPSTLPGENHYGYTWVPIDDESCWIYTYAWNPERPLTLQEREKLERGHGVVGEVGPDFVPIRNRANHYLLDRREQREHSFTGVRGIAEQDAMVQDSQGLIADRTREHLTATDAAIVRFRRAVISGARALQTGQPPEAANKPEAYRLRSGSWVAADGVPFEAVMQERFGDPVGKVSMSSARPEPFH
ncbi:MAG: ring-hydroxylating oxygenase subunit alpha [Betaproteobacteria bacterium]|nr:ring-hydroxylating oxygenase subunit alpha [Betaproteobacteria bacterium]